MSINKDIMAVESVPAAESQLLMRKFEKLAAEYFQLDTQKKIEGVELVQGAARINRLPLPSNINELFIDSIHAPFFWIFDGALQKSIDDFFRFHSKAGVNEQFQMIRNYYSKWLLNNSEGEKRYYANSLINLVEKGNKSNFYFLLLHAVVLIYCEPLKNIPKALELLQKSKELMHSSKVPEYLPAGQREELVYYIDLFTGFAFYALENAAEANEQFKLCLKTKPHGITAKFYLVLTENLLNRTDVVFHLLKEIFSYDIFRLEFAISLSDTNMFAVLLKNSVFSRIFYQAALFPLADEIEIILAEVTAADKNLYELRNKLAALDEMQYKNFYNEEASRIISFLEKMIKEYLNNNDVLFLSVVPFIFKRFERLVEIITSGISEKYKGELSVKLTIYDQHISDINTATERLKKEGDDIRKKIAVRLKDSLEKTERNITYQVHEAEERINNLQNETNYNPKNTFGNAMTYNIIISFVVFMMGGCAGYTHNYTDSFWSFNDFMSFVVLTGFKWSLGSFAVGSIISVIASGLVIAERSNKKQRLLQFISYLKNEKEKLIAGLKQEAAEAEISAQKTLQKRLEIQDAELKKILDERKRQEELFRKETEEEITKQIEKLNLLLA